MKPVLALACLTLLAAAPRAHTPAEAIAMADKAGPDGAPGRFEMKVVSAARVRHVAELYSAADALGAETLTISLSKPAISAFKKKHGVLPERYLPGRTVFVDGAVRAVTVGTDTKRTLHEIWVYELSQFASIR